MKTLSIVKNVRLTGILTLLSIAFLGCSAGNGSVADQSNCELNLDAVCSRITETLSAKLATLRAHVGPSRGPRLELLIIPVKMPGGELAAEVDCYASLSADSSWLVYAHLVSNSAGLTTRGELSARARALQ